MQFLTDKLTAFPQHSEDHKIHKPSQTPLSFHRLSRPWKAYPTFPKLSKTFKDHANPVPKSVFKIQDYFIISSEELKRLLVFSSAKYKKQSMMTFLKSQWIWERTKNTFWKETMTWHAKHEEHIQHKRLIICSSSSTRHPLHQLIHLKDRMTTIGIVLCSIDYPKTKLGVITEVTTQPVDHDMSYNCTRPELFFS